MKKNLLIVACFFITSNIFAQTGASILKDTLINLLQSEKVLLTKDQKDCMDKNCTPFAPWKNNHQRKKEIQKDSALMKFLVGNFTPPGFVTDKKIVPELTYSGQSLTRIGRFLIRNGDLSVINKTEPTLPILNINQISIPNPLPGASNYYLNYSMNNLFKNDASATLKGDLLTYVNAKLAFQNNLSSEKKLKINIAAGKFENELASLYKKTLNRTISPTEFTPLYYLWLAYKNETAKEGDQIISYFDGMCFYTSNETDNSTHTTFDATVHSSGTFPILSYGVDDKTNWEKTDERETGTRDYHIYLFKKPELMNIPTLAQIKQSWKDVSKLSDPITINSNTIIANTQLTFQVKFGPIPSSEFSTIRLDTGYIFKQLKGVNFISNISINSDPNQVVNKGEGFYVFKIDVTRDENFMSNYSSAATRVISADFPIRIYLDNGINGSYLETYYPPIHLETEVNPVPYVNPYNMISTKDATFYTYKANLQFDTPNGMIIQTSPTPPKVASIQSSTNADQELVSIIKNSTIKATANNNYEMSFKVPVAKKYFSFTKPSHDFYCIVNFFGNNHSFQRRFDFTVMGPDNQIIPDSAAVNAQVKLNDNSAIISSLNGAAKLSNGMKVIDLIKLNSTNGQLDVVKFVDELKKTASLSVTADNKYLIDSKLLNSTNVSTVK